MPASALQPSSKPRSPPDRRVRIVRQSGTMCQLNQHLKSRFEAEIGK